MKMMSRFEPWTVLQRVFGAWAVAALLAACGSSQVETFQPNALPADLASLPAIKPGSK